MGKYTVSRESRDLEQNLAAMLARVEHRQQQGLASDADHDMNRMLYNGLRAATALTHNFTQACERDHSPRYCARKLSDMALSMQIIVKMIEGMEGEKHLSPLFDRQMNREYKELYKLAYQVRDAVHADGDKLRSNLPSPAEKPAKAAPMNPVALTCVLVAMPLIMTVGVMMGIAQGIKDVRAKRHDPEPPEQPEQGKRHLSLVHSVK